MTTKPLYIDRDGNSITLEQMSTLMIDHDYCRIKKTTIAHIEGTEKIEISTVWLPGRISPTSGRAMYETMIFGGPEDGWQRQYDDVEEAKQGHNFAVMLSNGMRIQDRLVK